MSNGSLIPKLKIKMASAKGSSIQKRKLADTSGGETSEGKKSKKNSKEVGMRKQSSQSMESMDSCASGIISDACISRQTKQSTQQGYNNRGIRVDLNTAEMSEQLPEDTKIFITNKDTTVQLSKCIRLR